MLFEFALEPALVARWQDRREFLFFDEKFGINARRVVSRFPGSKWRKLVWEAFERSEAAEDQNARKRLDALLNHLCQCSVKRQSPIVQSENWLEKAAEEHALRPFRAILALKNQCGQPDLICAEDLVQSGHHHLWQLPEHATVPRNAAELARAVIPILRISREVIVVDPYFDPGKKRFRETLRAFLHETWNRSYLRTAARVELHMSLLRYRNPGEHLDRTEEKRCFENLKSDCRKKLPGLIPADKELIIRVWRQRNQGEKLHNRYILTDVAGVLFGTGIDQSNRRNSAETDDLALLTAVQHRQRREQYRAEMTHFDPVGAAFKIVGKARPG